MKADLLLLCIPVLLDIGLGTLEDDTTLFLVGLRNVSISTELLHALDETWRCSISLAAQPRKMVNKSDNIDPRV